MLSIGSAVYGMQPVLEMPEFLYRVMPSVIYKSSGEDLAYSIIEEELNYRYWYTLENVIKEFSQYPFKKYGPVIVALDVKKIGAERFTFKLEREDYGLMAHFALPFESRFVFGNNVYVLTKDKVIELGGQVGYRMDTHLSDLLARYNA